MSRHVIDQFMWPFQHLFRSSYELRARHIFESLDRELRPDLFLVGIRLPDSKEPFSACVEPETGYWIKAHDFDAICESVDSRYAQAVGEPGMSPDAEVAARAQLQVNSEDVRQRVSQLVNEHADRPDDMSFEVSTPEIIGDYAVCIVLGLHAAPMARYATLTSDETQVHPFLTYRHPRSFIEAVALAFLERAAADLHQPNAGQQLCQIDTDELLRTAGQRFMAGVARRVDVDSRTGPHTLLRDVNAIAALTYERADAAGQIVLASRESDTVTRCVEFEQPVRLSETRRARKLLELASRGLALHCDSENLFGLVAPATSPDEDVFTVTIHKRSEWDVSCNGRTLMRVSHGTPALPRSTFDRDRLARDLPRIFSTTTTDVDALCEIVRVASEESHGTMLVITDAAGDESSRLANQATQITPCRLTPDLIRHLTPIDGAIILAPDGTCSAIGAILDGMATPSGDPSRGSRYNSALRYQRSATQNCNCLVIVVSEDGGVDVIPEMRPPLSHRLLRRKIDALLNLQSADQINRALFVDQRDWIREHQFYLSESQCDEVNSAIEAIELRQSENEGESARSLYPPLQPDPLMDESLYLVD